MIKKHVKSWPAKTSYFEGSIKRYASGAFSFGVDFASKPLCFFMFFLERLLDFIFSHFPWILLEKCDFGPPLGAQLGPNSDPNHPSASQMPTFQGAPGNQNELSHSTVLVVFCQDGFWAPKKGEKMSPQCRPSTPKGFQRWRWHVPKCLKGD